MKINRKEITGVEIAQQVTLACYTAMLQVLKTDLRKQMSHVKLYTLNL